MINKGSSNKPKTLSPTQTRSRIDKQLSLILERAVGPKIPIEKSGYTPFHFRLSKEGAPLAKARINWKTGDGEKAEVDWIPRTNGDGWGMITIPTPKPPDHDLLQLEVDLKGKWKTIPGIELKQSKTIRRFNGSDGLTLEIIPPAGIKKKTPPARKRSRRITLAVVGKPDQLKEAIPMLESIACFRVKKVFVEGKATRSSLALNKKIELVKISADLLTQLKEVQVLVDLTDNQQIQELYQSQIKGDPKTKAMIISEGQRFLGRADLLLAYYERIKGPEPDSQ